MMETHQTDRTKTRVKWALGISLALNLLVAGAIGGAIFRHMGEGPDTRQRGGQGAHSYGAPYVQALPRAQRRALREEIRELPKTQARVIGMRYLDGSEVGEIAKREGVAPPTVRSNLARGLQSLRERLDRRFG